MIFCTTEWDILIFGLLNDLNCTFNGYFTPLLEEKFFRNFGDSSIGEKNVPPLAAKIRQTGENPSTAEITQFDRLTIRFLLEFDLALLAQKRPSYGPKRTSVKNFVMFFLYFNLRHP